MNEDNDKHMRNCRREARLGHMNIKQSISHVQNGSLDTKSSPMHLKLVHTNETLQVKTLLTIVDNRIEYTWSFVRQDKQRRGEKSRSSYWFLACIRPPGARTDHSTFFHFLVMSKYLPFVEKSEWENHCEMSKLSFCCTVRPPERPIMQQVSKENTPIVLIINISDKCFHNYHYNLGTSWECLITVKILDRKWNNSIPQSQ